MEFYSLPSSVLKNDASIKYFALLWLEFALEGIQEWCEQMDLARHSDGQTDRQSGWLTEWRWRWEKLTCDHIQSYLSPLCRAPLAPLAPSAASIRDALLMLKLQLLKPTRGSSFESRASLTGRMTDATGELKVRKCGEQRSFVDSSYLRLSVALSRSSLEFSWIYIAGQSGWPFGCTIEAPRIWANLSPQWELLWEWMQPRCIHSEQFSSLLGAALGVAQRRLRRGATRGEREERVSFAELAFRQQYERTFSTAALMLFDSNGRDQHQERIWNGFKAVRTKRFSRPRFVKLELKWSDASLHLLRVLPVSPRLVYRFQYSSVNKIEQFNSINHLNNDQLSSFIINTLKQISGLRRDSRWIHFSALSDSQDNKIITSCDHKFILAYFFHESVNQIWLLLITNYIHQLP